MTDIKPGDRVKINPENRSEESKRDPYDSLYFGIGKPFTVSRVEGGVAFMEEHPGVPFNVHKLVCVDKENS